MKSTYKLVIIDWLDSKGITDTWEQKDDLESMPPCKCQSVGWMLEETKEFKTITQSMCKEEVLGRLTIPTCSILKIITIKEK